MHAWPAPVTTLRLNRQVGVLDGFLEGGPGAAEAARRHIEPLRLEHMGRLGSAFAPFLVGSLAPTHGFGTAFAMLAGALMLGATTWIWLPETRGRRLES